MKIFRKITVNWGDGKITHINKNTKNKLHTISTFLEMIWCIIIKFFGYKYNEDLIPKGTPYCYLPDVEKNKENNDSSTYYIKPCPYYRYVSTNLRGCKFLGCIVDDFLLYDQCKICGIGSYDDEEK